MAAGPLDRSFADGECVMLCGSNGSGKTTLMKTIAGLIPPLGGSFSVSGKTVMVPTRISKVKGFTVREFIQTSIRTGIAGASDVREAVDRAVDLLRLGHIQNCDISHVSDGEFQKACIATHRVRCKMTQEFVAERLGVSRQAVSKWENGTSEPSTSNLLALAKLYGVSPEELLKTVQ